MRTESCTVCGRPVVSEWGWHPETDVCPRVPVTGTRYDGHDFDSRTECYRAGYEREKHRADASETALAEAGDIIAELKAERDEARGLAWRLRRAVMVVDSPGLWTIFGTMWYEVISQAAQIPEEDWKP